jgi:hypothetical protein
MSALRDPFGRVLADVAAREAELEAARRQIGEGHAEVTARMLVATEESARLQRRNLRLTWLILTLTGIGCIFGILTWWSTCR